MWRIEYNANPVAGEWLRPTTQGGSQFATEGSARAAIAMHIFGRYTWAKEWRIIAPDGTVIDY